MWGKHDVIYFAKGAHTNKMEIMLGGNLWAFPPFWSFHICTNNDRLQYNKFTLSSAAIGTNLNVVFVLINTNFALIIIKHFRIQYMHRAGFLIHVGFGFDTCVSDMLK